MHEYHPSGREGPTFLALGRRPPDSLQIFIWHFAPWPWERRDMGQTAEQEGEEEEEEQSRSYRRGRRRRRHPTNRH